MAKLKIKYSCNSCGTEYPRWQGQCSECNEWNSISEEQLTSSAQGVLTSKAKAGNIVSLNSETAPLPRIDSGMSEFNRVLGGGFVRGSAILIGGDPGIGKSTILLQVMSNLSNQHIEKENPQSPKHKILYISGEESAHQIQMRAKRLGVDKSPLSLSNVASLEVALATIRQEKPALVVIDSIQTMYSEASTSAPGTVSQVRTCANELTQEAKRSNTIIIFVGHVTKDGNIAGPRVLEHMVDTVMYFEGERGHAFRLLRSFKNRFGATNEIGVFEMGEAGLKEVPNPSSLFLAERPEDSSGSAVIASMNGTRPVLMEIQALVTKSTLAQPRRTTLGVDSARVAMIAAVLDKHAGYNLSTQDIFLNVTGGMKITEPAADLAIAAALISSLMNKPLKQNELVFGEIGLSGEVRTVSHTQQRLKESSKLGFKKILCPPLAEEIKTGKLNICAVKNINEIGQKLL